MYELKTFTQADMCRCAVALRNMDERSTCMEETADRIVRYLYENLVVPSTGQPACALVRFFKTHPYGNLGVAEQRAARAILKERSIPNATKCLTLLATAGDKPDWNWKHRSTGHQAIPLIDQEFIDRAPMIRQLIQQFGLKVSSILEPSPAWVMQGPQKFNIFYVPKALESPYIPAQAQFVIPYEIQSVLGFGGLLPTGELFAVLLFSKVPIPLETAQRFKWVSAYVRIAVESFSQENTFSRGTLALEVR